MHKEAASIILGASLVGLFCAIFSAPQEESEEKRMVAWAECPWPSVRQVSQMVH